MVWYVSPRARAGAGAGAEAKCVVGISVLTALIYENRDISKLTNALSGIVKGE